MKLILATVLALTPPFLLGCGEKGPTTVHYMIPEAPTFLGRLAEDDYRLIITYLDTTEVHPCPELREQLNSAEVRLVTAESDSTYRLNDASFQPSGGGDFCLIYVDSDIEISDNTLFAVEYSPDTFFPEDSVRISIAPVPWP